MEVFFGKWNFFGHLTTNLFWMCIERVLDVVSGGVSGGIVPKIEIVSPSFDSKSDAS